MLYTTYRTFRRTLLADRHEVRELKTELAVLAGCRPWHVRLKNFRQFKQGHRYLYFTAGNAFGKVASHPETKIQLEREGSSTEVAHSLGIPTVRVLVPYRELRDGNGVLLVDRLSNRFGSLIREYRDTAQISQAGSRRYAESAAHAIFQSNFRMLSPAVSTPQLLRNEEAAWAVWSPASVIKKIKEITALYDLSAIQKSLPEAFTGCDFGRIRSLFQCLSSNVTELTSVWGQASHEYFAHNDTTVKNIYFGSGRSEQNAFLLDFEMAAASRYPVLSLLRDITQFYSFTSHNQLLQQHFLRTVVEIDCDHVPVAAPEQRTLLVRTAILLGTLHLSHFALQRALEQQALTGISLADAIRQDSEYELISHLFANCLPNIDFIHGNPEDMQGTVPAIASEPITAGI